MQKTALKTVPYDLCSDGRPIPLCEVNGGVKKTPWGVAPRTGAAAAGRTPPVVPQSSDPSSLSRGLRRPDLLLGARLKNRLGDLVFTLINTKLDPRST